MPTVAHLATAEARWRHSRATPVWFEWDGNPREDQPNQGPARRCATWPHDPPRRACRSPIRRTRTGYVEIRGVVDRIEDDTDRQFIEHLSQRYLGRAYPNHQPGDERVIVYIRPTDSSAAARPDTRKAL